MVCLKTTLVYRMGFLVRWFNPFRTENESFVSVNVYITVKPPAQVYR